MTDLARLAVAHRWRLTRTPFDGSALGDPLVQGKRGSLWDDAPGRLGLTTQATPTIWNRARRQLLESGATLNQNGDGEGSVTFPADEAHTVALAASLAGIRSRRSASAADHLRRFAFGTPTEAISGPTAGAGGAARPGQASTEREPAP